jgi:hypothetical protein
MGLILSYAFSGTYRPSRNFLMPYNDSTAFISSPVFDVGKVTLKSLKLSSQQLSLHNPIKGLPEWTISMWIKNNGSSDWTDFFTFADGYSRLEIHNSNASWTWYCNNTSYGDIITSGTRIMDGAKTGVWYNFVLTHSYGTTTVYVDGVQKVQQTGKTTVTGTEESITYIYLGSRIGSNYANMSINDLRFYDHCLSPIEVQNLKKGLVLHYRFDDLYRDVDYIRSTGNQYINTGVKWVNGSSLTFEVTLKYPSTTSTSGVGHHRCAISNVSGKLKVGYTQTNLDATEWHTAKVVWGKGNTGDTITMTNYADGVQVGTHSTQPYDNNPYLLFALCSWNDNTGVPPYSYDSVLISSCKFYQNDVLIRDFIPVIRATDNAVGLYDQVNDVFYSNNGSGVFTANKLMSTSDSNLKNVTDFSGHNYYATLTTPTAFSVTKDAKTGEFALRNVSGNSSAKINTTLNPSFITNGTICFWYKKDSSAFNYNSGYFLVATQNSAGYYFGAMDGSSVWHSGASHSTFYVDGVARTNGAINDTNWHFYCFTGVNLSSWTSFCLHAHGDTSWLYRGNISDFKIYSTSLSTDEIKDLYESRAKIDNKCNMYCEKLDNKHFNDCRLTNNGVFSVENYMRYAGYEKVDYIQSNGTQYINLGVAHNSSNKTKLMMRVGYTTLSPANQIMGFTGNAGCGIGTSGSTWWEVSGANNLTTSGSYVVYWEKQGANYSRTIKTDGVTVSGTNGNTSMTNNMLLFAAYETAGSSTITYYCHCKLFGCRVFQNDVLIRDLIPCRRISDGEVGLYDIKNNYFYTNNGTGKFTCGYQTLGNLKNFNRFYKEENDVSIYDSYEELEFIEANGTQQIDTGLKFDMQRDSCEVEFQSTVSAQNGMIFASNNSTNHFWFYHYNDSKRIDLYIKSGGSQVGLGGIAIDLNRHKMTYKDNKYMIDGKVIGTDTRTLNTTDYNMYLFSWGSNYYYKGRIFGCKMYKNGAIVRDFMPAKRKSDNVIGMFDKVTKKFYTNSGSGTFVAGPSKNKKSQILAKNVYEGMGANVIPVEEKGWHQIDNSSSSVSFNISGTSFTVDGFNPFAEKTRVDLEINISVYWEGYEDGNYTYDDYTNTYNLYGLEVGCGFSTLEDSLYKSYEKKHDGYRPATMSYMWFCIDRVLDNGFYVFGDSGFESYDDATSEYWYCSLGVKITKVEQYY